MVLWVIAVYKRHGRLGKPFIPLLPQLEDLAVLRSDNLFTKRQFVSGVTRELIVCLCWCKARVEHAVAGFFGRASIQLVTFMVGFLSCTLVYLMCL
jgi:hypothetical protein